MRRIALAVSRGSGSGPDPAGLAARLRTLGATVESFEREEVERAAASGAERLAVAGGDGSVGPAAAAASAAGLPLAVIPVGTANNFARAAGVPADVQRACALAVRGERLQPMELGHAGELPFVNLASAGLAPVAAERALRLKRVLGPTAYAVGAAVAALRTPPLECEVRADQVTAFAGSAWQVMVAVSGAFGSGARVELADTGDGQFDLVLHPAGPRRELARHGWRLRAGELVSQPGMLHRRALVVEVDVEPGTAFNVDGEVLELGATRFSIEREGFQLVVG